MDETTTTVDVEDVQGEQSQPETPQETAEGSTGDAQTDPQGTDESVVSETDQSGDLSLDWLARSKGVDVNDPKAVAEAWRKAEQEFHRGRQESKQSLQDAVTPADTDASEQMRRELTEMRFYMDNPEAKGREAELIAVAEDYPELGGSFNLNALWEIAKSRSAKADLEAARKEGREAAKTEIARASSATAPKGNASVPPSASRTDEQKRLETFSNWD